VTQQLRISQFVITYGPGAIIEGAEGPRVIPLPDIGLFKRIPNLNPSDYEVLDQRMTDGLLRGTRIFRLPSNAELGIPEDQYIYSTKPFPLWKLCLNIQGHKGDFYVLYDQPECPVCGNTGGRGREAIRFIKACPDGHMDEVDWYHLAHGSGSSCQHTGWFRWHGGGGSLSGVRIECPRCGSSKFTLGWAYGKEWDCSGRYPERELPYSPPHRPGCGKKAKIIQRQASNLRIPELLTLFSIPPRHTKLHNLLQIGPIFSAIVAKNPSSMKQFKEMLSRLQEKGLISGSTLAEILSSPWPEIRSAIQDVLTPVPRSYHELIMEEFHALVEGSIHGIPPIPGPTPHSPTLIEINPYLVRRFNGAEGKLFRITPVLRLRTVTVQRGYRRDVGSDVIPKLVDVSFPDPVFPQQRWYPGVEFPGEGIFIIFDENDGWNFRIKGETAKIWLDAFNASSYPDYVFRDPSLREELHPLFVWWHTFSHFLIRSIAAESGYSSASIRERVYFEHGDTAARGGVLVYATQPGSEGTLGGLVALTPYFQDILDVIFEQLEVCSGDPLCLEHRFRAGDYNGAACYGCVLLSETSCEHRNMWLDRHVMLENLP